MYSLLMWWPRYVNPGIQDITDSTGIYEIRVEVGSDIFRAFSFFDEGMLIIVINGFQKKSQKTPKKEIALAEKLKKQYFDEKEA
jgi:phage-related protein